MLFSPRTPMAASNCFTSAAASTATVSGDRMKVQMPLRERFTDECEPENVEGVFFFFHGTPASLASASTCNVDGVSPSDPVPPLRSSKDMATARAALQDNKTDHLESHARLTADLGPGQLAQETEAFV